MAQARQPGLYSHFQVPDTVDGRFEMVALHAFLVLHRLKDAPPPAAELAQAIFDAMFADMDLSLREMGAGDLGVGRRVKAMAQGFYGRTAAYEAALARPEDASLIEALRRNVYGTLHGLEAPSDAAVEALGRYARASVAELARQPIEGLLGEIAPRFAPAPGH